MLKLRVTLLVRRCLTAAAVGVGLATVITYEAAAGRELNHSEPLT